MVRPQEDRMPVLRIATATDRHHPEVVILQVEVIRGLRHMVVPHVPEVEEAEAVTDVENKEIKNKLAF